MSSETRAAGECRLMPTPIHRHATLLLDGRTPVRVLFIDTDGRVCVQLVPGVGVRVVEAGRLGVAVPALEAALKRRGQWERRSGETAGQGVLLEGE